VTRWGEKGVIALDDFLHKEWPERDAGVFFDWHRGRGADFAPIGDQPPTSSTWVQQGKLWVFYAERLFAIPSLGSRNPEIFITFWISAWPILSQALPIFRFGPERTAWNKPGPRLYERFAGLQARAASEGGATGRYAFAGDAGDTQRRRSAPGWTFHPPPRPTGRLPQAVKLPLVELPSGSWVCWRGRPAVEGGCTLPPLRNTIHSALGWPVFLETDVSHRQFQPMPVMSEGPLLDARISNSVSGPKPSSDRRTPRYLLEEVSGACAIGLAFVPGGRNLRPASASFSLRRSSSMALAKRLCPDATVPHQHKYAQG